jgi:hypothetical protein
MKAEKSDFHSFTFSMITIYVMQFKMSCDYEAPEAYKWIRARIISFSTCLTDTHEKEKENVRFNWFIALNFSLFAETKKKALNSGVRRGRRKKLIIQHFFPLSVSRCAFLYFYCFISHHTPTVYFYFHFHFHLNIEWVEGHRERL